MADPSTNTNITDAITSNNLEHLKSALTQSFNSLLVLAITNNSHLTIPHLISLGASAHTDQAFTALLAPGTFPALLTLIKQCNYNVNTNLDRLGTFLILSIKRNNADEVRTLLSHGANPDLGLYAHIYSPLASAVEYGASLEIINILLRAGATVQGSDALHVAALKGRVDILRQLLDSGTNVNEIGFEYCAVDSFTEMAGSGLHFAVDGGSEVAVKLLLENGADRHLRDAQGRTALMRARENGFEAGIALLDE